jgi:phosphoribosyl 1,2-cyclic phosphodiesterase
MRDKSDVDRIHLSHLAHTNQDGELARVVVKKMLSH